MGEPNWERLFQVGLHRKLSYRRPTVRDNKQRWLLLAQGVIPSYASFVLTLLRRALELYL